MKKALIALLIGCLLTFSSCSSSKRTASFGFFGDQIIALITENSHAVILHLDVAMVEGYAQEYVIDVKDALPRLFHVSSSTFFGGSEEGLAEIQALLLTLASESLGKERNMVTAEDTLSVLQKRAGDLRKTSFDSTLAKTTGLSDALALLQKMKSCHTYDMRQFVTIDKETDWKFMQEYLSQWLRFALLLD